MKKAFLLFFLLTGLWSCFCDDIPPYWNVTDFQLNAMDRNYQVANNGVIDTDTLILSLDLNTEFLSNATPFAPAAFLSNRLLATSCEDPGYSGMKDPWHSITVYSNRDLNDVPAGEPLNDMILVNGYNRLDELVANSNAYAHWRGLELWLTQRPDEVEWRTFTVRMEFDSGKVLERDSETVVRW